MPPLAATAQAPPTQTTIVKLLLIGDSGASRAVRYGFSSGDGMRAHASAVACASPPTAAVGKSCLLLRFADDQFSTSFITTIGSVRFSLFPGESARASLGPARARALEPPGALGAARA